MTLTGRLIGWIGRRALLFGVLVSALFAYAVYESGDLQRSWHHSQTFNADQARHLDAIFNETRAKRQKLEMALQQSGERAKAASIVELEKQDREVRNEIIRLTAHQPDRLQQLLAVTTLDIDAIKQEQERMLQLAFLERERDGLALALRAAHDHEAALVAFKSAALETADRIRQNRLNAEGNVRANQRAWEKSAKVCDAANAELSAFDRSWLRRSIARLPFQAQREDLDRTKNAACAGVKAARDAFNRARSVAEGWQRMRGDAAHPPTRRGDWVDGSLSHATARLESRLLNEREMAARTISARVNRIWTRYNGEVIFIRALLALLIILGSPYMIRLFCWFVLAPVAMRRASIELSVPQGGGASIGVGAASATTVALRVLPGEEILVRQDYLQTSSLSGTKQTQWFLDWKKPLTSFASGLVFLTRIRGDGEIITISATRDGLAEVTLLALPVGASCVLQPRALAAVAQPIGHPVRVSSHWRLGSLNAWLTMQLRYLVFHGPARLVLKGGRGVRVEPAERGRVFGQDQLLGFSADLAYAVARSETFWPYFVGREPLLKDRVQAGDGVLIVEEAPLSVRLGKRSRGIEGLIDAGMKAFGM